jgi:FkbM family methyltransferase
MKSVHHRTKRLIERLFGVEIERLSSKTFFVVDPSKRAQAWYSYRATLQSILEKLDVNHVLDVGANAGQFGQIVRTFYPGRISSFEPVATVFESLLTTIASDEKWDAHQYALGRNAGMEHVHVSELSQFCSLLKTNDYCVARFGQATAGTKEESIRIRRLDEVLDEIAPRPAKARIYLKLDTQGYDIEVFKGLGDRLSDVVALQSEVSLIPIYEHMPHWTESILEYEKAGFGVAAMYPISTDSGRVVEYDCILLKK